MRCLSDRTAADAGRATIDLDVTDNIKLRGEAGQKGSGKVGISFEREYWAGTVLPGNQIKQLTFYAKTLPTQRRI